MAPGEPMISRDNLDSMKTPSVASGPLAPELGIDEPASIETIAPMYLTGSVAAFALQRVSRARRDR